MLQQPTSSRQRTFLEPNRQTVSKISHLIINILLTLTFIFTDRSRMLAKQYKHFRPTNTYTSNEVTPVLMKSHQNVRSPLTSSTNNQTMFDSTDNINLNRTSLQNRAPDYIPTPPRKRITDGTTQKELLKAMSTYLNMAGAGDYNLPQMMGKKTSISTKNNDPIWSIQGRTKLPWCPSRRTEFIGSQSPPSTRYSPKSESKQNCPFNNTSFSIPSNLRFQLPNSINYKKLVPI